MVGWSGWGLTGEWSGWRADGRVVEMEGDGRLVEVEMVGEWSEWRRSSGSRCKLSSRGPDGRRRHCSSGSQNVFG